MSQARTSTPACSPLYGTSGPRWDLLKPAPPHYSIPDDLTELMIDAGLDPAAIGLHVIAWAESSRYQLDGRLPTSRLRRLRGWTRVRQDALVRAGFWTEDAAGIVIVNYLDVNKSLDEINELREKRQEAGRWGGTANARDAERDEHGRFVTDVVAERAQWHRDHAAGRHHSPAVGCPECPR